MAQYRTMSWSPPVAPTITALPEHQLFAWAADDQAALAAAEAEIRADLAAGRLTPPTRDYRTPGNPGGVRGALVGGRGAQSAPAVRVVESAPARPEVTSPHFPLALLLPGQGAQYPRMAAGLYEREPTFTAVLDQLFEAMGSSGEQLRLTWLADDLECGEAGSAFDHVSCAQPLLFAIEYALTTMVESWNVPIEAFLGHSIGEMTAAAKTGVFGVDEVLALIEDRVRALAAAPAGGLLAVAASACEARAVLPPEVSIAAVNGPRQVLVAGFEDGLARAQSVLRKNRITFRRALASTPFHHPDLRMAMAGTAPRTNRCAAPDRRLVSCYLAADLDLLAVRDPQYWHSHPYSPVMFADALDRLLASGPHLMLETGPSQGLAMLARQHPAVRTGPSTVVSLQPTQGAGAGAERHAVLHAMAELWRHDYLELFRTELG